MLKNISVKVQLSIIPFVIILSFFVLYFLVSSNLNMLDDKAYKASVANKMIKNMLEARIAEKNYTRRKDPQYVNELQKYISNNIAIAQDLQTRFTQQDNKELATQALKLFQNYEQAFQNYQNVREQSLKAEENMIKEARDVETIATKARKIQKQQRDRLIHEKASLGKIIDKIEKASLTNKIIKELNEIRISEKNYIRRKDPLYLKTIKTKIAEIKKLTKTLKADFDNQTNKKMMTQIDNALTQYEKALDSFTLLREQSFDLSSNMKKFARDSEAIAITIRKDQKKEREDIKTLFQQELLFLFLSSALIILLISLYITYNIIKNLTLINNAAKELASGDGDLTKRINLSGNNEIASVAKSINIFIEKVHHAITEAKNVSEEASSISNELSVTSLEIGQRVEEETSLVRNVNSSTSETMEDSNFVNNRTKEMHRISTISFKELENVTQKINTLVTTVQQSSLKEIELAAKMEELRNNTSDVKSILELIGDIAEQTNLLSLNAAIEAARAGEHGRGFAVVADEVRKLAERTQKSLVEINATINIVTQAVEEASDNMQENAQEVADAAEKAGDVEESIDNVMDSITNTQHMALESSQAVDKLQLSIRNIVKKMSQLSEMSNNNARSVEEIAAAAEHQNNVVEQLNQHLSEFKS